MWKPIKDFEDQYAINEYGVVKNIKRNSIRRPYNNYAGKGYLYIDLYKKNIRVKRESIHRLVAIHFVENKQGKPMINHIDGNTMNNHISNLEWVTSSENVEHASKILKIMNNYINHSNSQKRKVCQLKDGKHIKTYESIAQASKETGIPSSNIIYTCQGKQKHAHNFNWQYIEVGDE